LGLVRLSFLHLLQLLGRYALLLGGLGLRLLEIEVQRVLVQLHRETVHVVELLAVFDESDGIFAGFDAQGEILALVVGLQGVFAAVVLAEILDDRTRDGFAIGVFTYTLHRTGRLSHRDRRPQRRDQR